MSIGEKLRNLRLMKKKTLREQSEEFGVSLNSIYRWEHDLTIPKRTALKKMAEYYEVPLLWLLHEGDENGEVTEEELSVQPEYNNEQKLLKMYRKLSNVNKYKILGYIERVYIETLDESNSTLASLERE